MSHRIVTLMFFDSYSKIALINSNYSPQIENLAAS